MNERKAKMLLVVREVLLGNLSVEEALDQTQIKDKRTLVHWINAVKDIGTIEQESNKEACQKDVQVHKIAKSIKIDQIQLGPRLISSGENKKAGEEDNELEQKIILLQSELVELRKRNKEFLRFQNILTNRINDLEILIGYAERTYNIKILKVKKRYKNTL